jgi:hypothetical protein
MDVILQRMEDSQVGRRHDYCQESSQNKHQFSILKIVVSELIRTSLALQELLSGENLESQILSP